MYTTYPTTLPYPKIFEKKKRMLFYPLGTADDGIQAPPWFAGLISMHNTASCVGLKERVALPSSPIPGMSPVGKIDAGRMPLPSFSVRLETRILEVIVMCTALKYPSAC